MEQSETGWIFLLWRINGLFILLIRFHDAASSAAAHTADGPGLHLGEFVEDLIGMHAAHEKWLLNSYVLLIGYVVGEFLSVIYLVFVFCLLILSHSYCRDD